MCKKIFVTATNTDIGKTYTTKLLLEHFASLGFKVGVIKPIETGVIKQKYPDGDMLLSVVKKLNPLFKDIKVTDIVPISFELPAAPFIASNGTKISLEIINKAIKKLEALCDILIVEGAGGLYVPIEKEFMMIDMIKSLNIDTTLLVTHCSLGCINDTLLSEMALSKYDINYITTFNCKKEESNFTKVSKPYFLETKDKLLLLDKDIDTICELLYNKI